MLYLKSLNLAQNLVIFFHMKKIIKTDEEWKKELTAEQYHVARQKGTERAFTSPYYTSKEKGIYICVCCKNELFSSEHKFESGTGWPSFWDVIDPSYIQTREDHTYGMSRIEVTCARCDAHLGHLFDDGPVPTGLRYCINGVCLFFVKSVGG